MQISEIAHSLFEAWRDKQPMHNSLGLATSSNAELGRLIQSELHSLFVQHGREPIGWKIGLTSQPALDLFGAEEPMVGVIYADTVLEESATLAQSETHDPRIEGELLLEIAEPPGSGLDDQELIASLASVRAAFEIADSRLAGWPTAIGGATADNACCGFLLPAPSVASPGDVDFTATEMHIRSGSKVISEGRASACLGSVLNCYRWFVEDSHKRGRELRSGDIVLTGAMGPAAPMQAPAHYSLECAGVGSATLEYAGPE